MLNDNCLLWDTECLWDEKSSYPTTFNGKDQSYHWTNPAWLWLMLQGEAGDSGVISGMRGDCDVRIYVDLSAAIAGRQFNRHFGAILGQFFELAVYTFKQLILVSSSRIPLGPFLGHLWAIWGGFLKSIESPPRRVCLLRVRQRSHPLRWGPDGVSAAEVLREGGTQKER